MSCRATCIQPSPTNAHCSACHHTFSGVTAFDRHRRGGACLRPLAIGLHADRKGVWRMAGINPVARDWPFAARLADEGTETA